MIPASYYPTVYGTAYRQRSRPTLRYIITWPLVLTIDAILWCLTGQTWKSLRNEGAWKAVGP